MQPNPVGLLQQTSSLSSAPNRLSSLNEKETKTARFRRCGTCWRKEVYSQFELSCERCVTVWCSSICQITDLQRHKLCSTDDRLDEVKYIQIHSQKYAEQFELLIEEKRKNFKRSYPQIEEVQAALQNQGDRYRALLKQNGIACLALNDKLNQTDDGSLSKCIELLLACSKETGLAPLKSEMLPMQRKLFKKMHLLEFFPERFINLYASQNAPRDNFKRTIIDFLDLARPLKPHLSIEVDGPNWNYPENVIKAMRQLKASCMESACEFDGQLKFKTFLKLWIFKYLVSAPWSLEENCYTQFVEAVEQDDTPKLLASLNLIPFFDELIASRSPTNLGFILHQVRLGKLIPPPLISITQNRLGYVETLKFSPRLAETFCATGEVFFVDQPFNPNYVINWLFEIAPFFARAVTLCGVASVVGLARAIAVGILNARVDRDNPD